MKKLILSAIAVLIMSVPVMAQGEVTVYSNGNAVDTKGTIVDGRTLVPVRGVFEHMGYAVEWDGKTKTATLTNTDKNNVVTLTNGKTTFSVNDSEITPDVPQQIIDGHFMLPLRAVGEALSADVDWNGETKTAYISEKAENNTTQASDNKTDADSKTDTSKIPDNAIVEPNGDFAIPGVTITEIDPFDIDTPATEIEF